MFSNNFQAAFYLGVETMGLAIIIANIILCLSDVVFLLLSMFYQLDRTLSLSMITLLITGFSCFLWFDEHNYNLWASFLFFVASIIGIGFVVGSFFTENPIPL